MTLKFARSIFILSLIAILAVTVLPARNVRALSNDSADVVLPRMDSFVAQIKDGEADELRGIYVPEILAAHIVQQPSGMEAFVSPVENVATQFRLASKVGSTGLLAHNYLAGKNFAMLKEGQEFFLIYGDGKVSAFTVSEILQYQALEPYSTSGSFVDLENDDLLTTAELFTKIYSRPGQVVLQTCIEANGNQSWGRLFVIAEPS